MDCKNFINQTFDVLPELIKCSNFENCVFNAESRFERCNLRNCTFTEYEYFDHSNVICCDFVAGSTFDKSSCITEEDAE